MVRTESQAGVSRFCALTTLSHCTQHLISFNLNNLIKTRFVPNSAKCYLEGQRNMLILRHKFLRHKYRIYFLNENLQKYDNTVIQQHNFFSLNVKILLYHPWKIILPLQEYFYWWGISTSLGRFIQHWEAPIVRGFFHIWI